MPDSYAKNDEKHGVADTNRATLTDAEREAIEAAIATEHERGAWQWADTLRSLLARLA